MPCRHCGGEIGGKGPQARVCKPCQKKSHHRSATEWAKTHPRAKYYHEYYLAHKTEHNARSLKYMQNMDPALRIIKNRAWRAANRLPIKIKRILGLKTLAEARARLETKGKSR